RDIKSATFTEVVLTAQNSTDACFTEVQVEYTAEDPDSYVVPLAFASGDRLDQIRGSFPRAVLAQVIVRQRDGDTTGIIYDAILDKDFCKSLLDMIVRKRQVRGS